MIDSPPNSTDSPGQPRRRRLQFSTRALLLLISLCALVLGLWNSYVLIPYRSEVRSLAEIKKLGGEVFVGDTRPAWLKKLISDPSFRKTRAVHLSGTAITDADLVYLKAFPQLGGLILHGTSTTDAALVEINQMHGLIQLELSDTKVTRVILKDLTLLEDLDLSDNQLQHLQLENLPRLQSLRFGLSPVDDSQLKQLSQMPLLESISIGKVGGSTNVTDAGLEHLKGLSHLKRLYLFSTCVTDEGVAELKRALPNLQVSKYP
jgi:Leucine-rich repeat (LRR) protein